MEFIKELAMTICLCFILIFALLLMRNGDPINVVDIFQLVPCAALIRVYALMFNKTK